MVCVRGREKREGGGKWAEEGRERSRWRESESMGEIVRAFVSDSDM
jgi:hypothetical protein